MASFRGVLHCTYRYNPLWSLSQTKVFVFYSSSNKSTDEPVPPISLSVLLSPLEYRPIFPSNRTAIFFSEQPCDTLP